MNHPIPNHPNFVSIQTCINKYRSFVVVSHVGADGDGLGTMFGLYWAMIGLGKSVIPFSRNAIGDGYGGIPGVQRLRQDLRSEDIDCIIVVDVGSKDRVDLDLDSFDVPIVNIDHHSFNEQFGTINCIDTRVSSTAELVGWLLRSMGIPLTADIATSLLVGIYFDTGNLQHNVGSSTLQMVSYLLQTGANHSMIIQNLKALPEADIFSAWGKVLGNIDLIDEISLAFGLLSKAILSEISVPFQSLRLDRLSNLLSTIQESRSSLLLIEYKDKVYRGSLRSENFKGVDVERIAKQFGGGGHVRASGFKTTESVDNILQKIKSSIL